MPTPHRARPGSNRLDALPRLLAVAAIVLALTVSPLIDRHFTVLWAIHGPAVAATAGFVWWLTGTPRAPSPSTIRRREQ